MALIMIRDVEDKKGGMCFAVYMLKYVQDVRVEKVKLS